jgi:uncharacterized protein (DUF433 family)
VIIMMKSSKIKALADRISADPEVCGGRPCIRGTRIRVSDILEMLAQGASSDDIVSGYPYLDKNDVAAALSYGAGAVGDGRRPATGMRRPRQM